MRSTISKVSSGRVLSGAVVVAGCALSVVAGLFAEEPPPSAGARGTKKQTPSSKSTKPRKRVSVDAARARAKLTHNIYAATLEVMHERYFRNKERTVPAKALQDVFKEISEQESIDAKWIAVNSRAMSIDHEPKGDFEKSAVKALAGGKQTYERVENGTYRRAERISLMNRGCLNCHLGFGESGTRKRFAGLVISIPVNQPTGKVGSGKSKE